MRLESVLAASAVYEVWLAVDEHGRRIAFKLPRPEWAKRAEARASLEREASVLAALAPHPHVVVSYGLSEHRGRRGLATELLDGGDLVALAGAPSRQWEAAFVGVVAALRHAHAAGWAHRDVKARNVLFGTDGRARLIDFGSAARLGGPRPVGGVTPEHARPAAPEEPVNVADDAFAAAGLLYELARGPLPAPVSVPDTVRGAPRAPVLVSDAVREALAPAVEALLSAPEEPRPGSLSDLLNVIESVAPSRTYDSGDDST